jgi:hypothetical protein
MTLVGFIQMQENIWGPLITSFNDTDDEMTDMLKENVSDSDRRDHSCTC